MTHWGDGSREREAAESILKAYCGEAGPGDVMCGASAGDSQVWQSILQEVLAVGQGSIAQVQEQLQRHVEEIGTSFRLPNEGEERPWPMQPWRC